MTFDDLSTAIFTSKSLHRYITREKDRGVKVSNEIILPILLEQLSFSIYEIKNALVTLSDLVKKNRFSKLPKRWSMNFAEEGTLIYQQEKGSQALHFSLEVNPSFGIVSVISIDEREFASLLSENNITRELFDHETLLKEIRKEVLRQLEMSTTIRLVVMTPFGPVESCPGKPLVTVNYWGKMTPHFTMC